MCTCNPYFERYTYKNDFTTKSWLYMSIASFLFITTLSLKEIELGEDVKLPCKFPNLTRKGRLKWFKNDGPIIENDRIVIKRNGRLLKIKKAVEEDEGLYDCYDDVAKKVVVQYNVSVRRKDSPKDSANEKPEFKHPNQLTPYVEHTTGSTIIINCEATGAEPIRYRWFKNGRHLLRRRVDPSFESDKPAMKLVTLVNSDSANYTCLVANRYGNISYFMELKVQKAVHVRPFVERDTIKDQSVNGGENVTIPCWELMTNSEPEFKWLKWEEKPNKTLMSSYTDPESGEMTLDSNVADILPNYMYRKTKKSTLSQKNEETFIYGNELILQNVSEHDRGHYTCLISNKIGSDYASMYLQVKEKNDKTSAITVQTHSSGLQSSHMKVVVIVLASLVLIALLILAWLFVMWKVKKQRQISRENLALPNFDKKLNIVTEKRKQSSASSRAPLISVGSGRLNSESGGICGDIEDGIPIPYDPEWEIDRNCLQLYETLGEGAFGKVVRAYAPGLERCENTDSYVAIKMLKDDATEYELMDLISEMETMKNIGRHKNIINFLGCCTEKNPIYVVVEYAPNDNLRQFLRQKRPPPADGDFRPEPLLSIKDMVSFALQISKGMEYLAAKKCIHRDLAARNILVSDENIMKIADFGLARNVHEFEYYRKTTDGRLPVKWLAIEALFDRVYTTQSDVWAFGVLLWEIFTLGGSPYPGIPIEKLFDLLKSGFRMDRPTICPLEVYDIMVKCWFENPTRRPSFTDLVYEIEAFLEALTSPDYLEVIAGSITSMGSSHHHGDESSEEHDGSSDSSASIGNSVFPIPPERPVTVDVPC